MEEVEDPQQKIEEDLTSKTVDELKKLAKERNIEGSSTMKKADLIKALSDNL
ncbi:Rho termination factor N-terminal domain-containing protein [Clostridium perfringens]|nr:Rho termination factor N-terminal domain-containing protein [Clostridium perfringens]